jgi:uncharacterized protein (DUF2267 family)
MSALGIASFEHTVQLSHIWINELDASLKWNNKPRAYRLLKAVLHALRDRLQLNDAVSLGAQLPELLRGAYYEQWRPGKHPVKPRSKQEFLDQVSESFQRDPLEHPGQAVMAVLELLSKKLAVGESKDIRHALSEDIRTLWPEPYVEAGAVRR